MQNDIRYFQAIATVIPTLLVAIFFSARLFNPTEFKMPENRSAWAARVLTAALAITALIFIIMGERAALEALVSNEHLARRAATARRGFYFEVVIILLALVLRIVFRPIREVFKDKEHIRLAEWLTFGSFCIAAAVILLAPNISV